MKRKKKQNWKSEQDFKKREKETEATGFGLNNSITFCGSSTEKIKDKSEKNTMCVGCKEPCLHVQGLMFFQSCIINKMTLGKIKVKH